MQLTTIAAARPGLPVSPGIRQLGPGLNVVLGPNGCGKSTLQQLVRDLLDASAAERAEPGAPIAGAIGVTAGENRLRIVRCVRPGHPETTAVVASGNAGVPFSTELSPCPSLVRFANADNLHRVDELARLAATFSRPTINIESEPSEAGPFAAGNWEVVTRSLQQQVETAQLRAAATLRGQVRRQRALHTRRRWLDAQIVQQLDVVCALDQDWQGALRSAGGRRRNWRSNRARRCHRTAHDRGAANLAERGRRGHCRVLDDWRGNGCGTRG